MAYNAFVIVDKLTGEQFMAGSGKEVWATAGGAKLAFGRTGVRFDDQDEYVILQLVAPADVEPAAEPTAPTNQEEAAERISKLTREARSLITEAEGIADEWRVEFSFSVDYGMGGTYGEPHNWWSSSSEEDKPFEWISSSHSC